MNLSCDTYSELQLRELDLDLQDHLWSQEASYFKISYKAHCCFDSDQSYDTPYPCCNIFRLDYFKANKRRAISPFETP